MGNVKHLVWLFPFWIIPSAASGQSPLSLEQYHNRLPDHPQWEALEREVQTFDLAARGISLALSDGGTSVYAVVERNGTIFGAILPENESTNIAAEILAWHLARAFNVAELSSPGFFFWLSGQNLEEFKKILPSSPLRGTREQNRNRIVQAIAASPGGIAAVFKPWGLRPRDYEGLVLPEARQGAGDINREHRLEGSSATVVELLSCNGPQPSNSRVVRIGNGNTAENLAIRQLSAIFLIDALIQQYDRFSGGNLQTVTVDGISRFVAFDNGGVERYNAPSSTLFYLDFLQRFDREIAQKILALEAMLLDGRGEFLGLKSEREFLQAMGIERLPDILRNFKVSLRLVANHLRQQGHCFFD